MLKISAKLTPTEAPLSAVGLRLRDNITPVLTYSRERRLLL